MCTAKPGAGLQSTLPPTVVRTGDNVEIIVPNQDRLSRSGITYTGTNRRVRLRYPVSVPRSVEANQVFQILNATACKHPLILEDPYPSVSVANFTGANVDYVLTYWVDDAAKMGKVNADMRLMLLKAFENQEVPVSKYLAKRQRFSTHVYVRISGRPTCRLFHAA